MRLAFSSHEMTRLRHFRETGMKMWAICQHMQPRGRDEVVEAIDALIRAGGHIGGARAYLAQVFRHQADGVALVNGRPLRDMDFRRATFWRPMF